MRLCWITFLFLGLSSFSFATEIETEIPENEWVEWEEESLSIRSPFGYLIEMKNLGVGVKRRSIFFKCSINL